MFYHRSPFHSHTTIPLSWTPYIIATGISPSVRSSRCGSSLPCGSKKQKINVNDDSNIMYQDRSTRIVRNDKDQIVFSIDLPGVKATDIIVELHDSVLKVQTDRKDDNNETKKIERRFKITEEIDTESHNLKATIEDGVLDIIVPIVKPDEAKPLATYTIPIISEYPPTTTDETNQGKRVRFSVDVPGVTISNISLKVEDNVINLEATRKVFDNEKTTTRKYPVNRDQVNVETLKAYLSDGVLTVIGDVKEIKTKQITVLDKALSTLSLEDDSKDDEDMVVVETVADEK